MKKQLYFLILSISTLFIVNSCTDNDDNLYEEVSPVSVDLANVPYQKLSDYHFFDGEMKNMNPSLNVIPYEPANTLFTDYAHKKRFVWLPPGTSATYNGDAKVFELPVGSTIIKNFYYDHIQPSNTRKILETRIMIRKETGWIFAEYVWNDEQTEAYLDLNGSNVSVTFTENSVTRTANYRIPNESQCHTCHKLRDPATGTYTNAPIGIKPQSLNWEYNYGSQTKNQLTRWIELGIAQNNFSLPSAQNTVVNYNDATKSLELRVRSYFDMNCAHCHSELGHCYYRPMRMGFDETYNNRTNMGVCVDTQDMQDFPPALSKIVTPNNINRSMLYHRINTQNESYMMPLHGRSLIHEEGVALVEQWINSLQPCN
jgi:uncharacterized repeat protein (TIGR03806 family)